MIDDTAPSAAHAQNAFWGELAPTEHILQLYSSDREFLDSLEAFVAAGLVRGEAVIVIAAPEHRRALDERLAVRDGVDLAAARHDDLYIPADAAETLGRFMVDRQGQSWPDDDRFEAVVNGLLMRARWGGRRGPRQPRQRKVRAFGELVALLWASGRVGATVRLEHLWNRARHAGLGARPARRAEPASEPFPLFCAYPRIGLTQDTQASLRDICACHTRVIGDHGPA